ncbi:glycosyltransferase family A protein [Flavobacterium sp. LHD-85]|uniref:glycosyltransferase family A protein n=1 Tax=Flavobacterium sp. LHD-85 TaxID=3071410 RepID=UPI0027E1FAE6|nr:glycosyltransferase family A protein [Flavobacterium sp. LHD-85]MDQ6529598.1 glycosyltransferase family A protein [Flavobacterium sp. LHD-85]
MTIKKPKVSIIIPCYNNGRFIEETLNSVFLQTFSSWECIIINDGSVDNSEEVILKKICKDDRFKYIYQNNAGVCVARNIAIEASQGEYVLCLDGDDLISKNFLEETVKLLDSKPNLTIATSVVKFFGRSSGVLNVVSYDMAVLLAENQLVVTSLFRRLDFDRVGGFNINMKDGFEDWDFWISILKQNGSVECTTKATFYYRLLNISRNNQISQEREKKLRFQMWKNHKELFLEYFVDPTSYFEYKRYADSMEYKIGRLLLNPIRKARFWFVFLKEKAFFK